MKPNTLFIMVALMLSLFSSACSTPATQAPAVTVSPEVSQSSGVEDQTSLIDALRTNGAEVELGDPVEQPFLSVTGQIIKVDEQDVQVFEYESAELMEADATQVAPDGSSIGTTMVTWVEPPHFFKSGRILVLYVGKDAGVIDLLTGALGEQFAGQ